MYSILSIGATYFFSTLLKTIASADVVNIANLKNQIVVKNSDGKVLFGKGKVTKFATETYDPTTDNFDFSFICPVDDPSLGGKLTRDGQNTLTWFNGGNVLQNDKVIAKASVKVSVMGFVKDVVVPWSVTILSSPNSK